MTSTCDKHWLKDPDCEVCKNEEELKEPECIIATCPNCNFTYYKVVSICPCCRKENI